MCPGGLLEQCLHGAGGPDCPSNSVSGGLLDDLESCLEGCLPGAGGLQLQGRSSAMFLKYNCGARE